MEIPFTCFVSEIRCRLLRRQSHLSDTVVMAFEGESLATSKIITPNTILVLVNELNALVSVRCKRNKTEPNRTDSTIYHTVFPVRTRSWILYRMRIQLGELSIQNSIKFVLRALNSVIIHVTHPFAYRSSVG